MEVKLLSLQTSRCPVLCRGRESIARLLCNSTRMAMHAEFYAIFSSLLFCITTNTEISISCSICMEKPRAYNLAGRNLKLWGRRIRSLPQRSPKRGHWTLLFWFGCKVLVNKWPLLRRLMGNSYSTNHWVPEESGDSVLSISWMRFFTFFCPFQHMGCTIKCTLYHWALLPTAFF